MTSSCPRRRRSGSRCRRALLAADDGADAILMVVQPVEQAEKALARNAEDGLRAQLLELVGEDVAPGAWHWLAHVGSFPV